MKKRIGLNRIFSIAAVLLAMLLTACVHKGVTDPLITGMPFTPSVQPTETPKPTSTPTAIPSPTETPTPTSSPTPTPIVNGETDIVGLLSLENWQDAIEIPLTCEYVISKVNEFVNIRKGPGTEYEMVGKLRKNGYAKILERADGWTKVASGDVEGYISNEYLYMDEEALALISEMDAFTCKVTANRMNVRKEATTESPIIGYAYNAEEYTWYPELSDDEWYAIQYSEDTIAYVSADYTEAITKFDNALTMEQEEARAKAEALAKALEQSKKHPPTKVTRDPFPLSDEDTYLMAVVVAMEALDEPYEGKIMVANVIINRMINGWWGHSLKEVVYAPGQFTGANSGRVEAFWNRVNDDCLNAVSEALQGYNNIEDYLFFITIGKARFDLYKKYYVFHGHCFYDRDW